jgi:hypothetical protein
MRLWSKSWLILLMIRTPHDGTGDACRRQQESREIYSNFVNDYDKSNTDLLTYVTFEDNRCDYRLYNPWVRSRCPVGSSSPYVCLHLIQ